MDRNASTHTGGTREGSARRAVGGFSGSARRGREAFGALARRGRALRAAAAAALALAALGAGATSAGAHTWNLEAEVPASADGVTAPANPFPDRYTNPGVWTLGFGGGGSYTTVGGERVYSGIASFDTEGVWSGNVEGVPGVEAWYHGSLNNFPYIGVNHTESAVGAWPAGAVFTHPQPDGSLEASRGAASWTSPITGSVKVQATFTDLDCGGGDGMDYSVEKQAAGSSTITHLSGKAVNCASGSYDSGSVSVVKGDTYYFSVGDGGNGDFLYDTTGLAVKISDGASDPLTITVPKEASAVYRHAIAPITVSGKDSDGDAVTLVASNVPAGLSFNASTGVLSGTIASPASRYAITFSANDGHGETVTRQWPLTVERATCAIVNKAALLTSAAKPAVSEKLVEAGTKFGLANREVEFSAYPVSGGGTGLATKTTSTGVAKPKWVGAQPGVYSVDVQFNGDGYYNACGNANPEIVTLYPTTYTTTGGGSIAVGRTTASFGYLAVQGETEPSGAALMRTSAGVLEVPSMATATIAKPTATSATVTGPGLWNGQEAQYTLTASDPGTGADTLGVTVSVEGTPVWSSNGPQAVKGGDAKVH